MYKVNHKAVLLVFLLQIIVGGVWYASAPSIFLDRFVVDGLLARPSISLVLGFLVSVLMYLYFSAWLLSKVKGISGLGRFFLVVGLWLFAVLPNTMFVCAYLGFDSSEMIFLLSYCAINSAIAAIILPLWRSSRSIFKD